MSKVRSDVDVEATIEDILKHIQSTEKQLNIVTVIQLAVVLWLSFHTFGA